jgi:hypothetical protein
MTTVSSLLSAADAFEGSNASNASSITIAKYII